MFTIQPSKEVAKLLSEAQKFATDKKNGTLTSYHALYVVSNSQIGKTELMALGLNSDNIESVKREIETALSKIPPPKHNEALLLSGEFRALLQNADAFAAKKQLTNINVPTLIAVFRTKDYHTSELLLRHGASAPKYSTVAELMLSTAVTQKANEDIENQKDKVDIDLFTENMTQLSVYYDPIVCRERELNLITDILLRRTKNNPLVLGLPGVGKTALIEGLAQKLQNNDTPENLHGSQLLRLDLTNLAAGAKFQGDLEERVKGLMQYILDSDNGVILFIDEIHLLGMPGPMTTVANMLKPALARGRIRLIGASTRKEYDAHIAKDPALSRRFEIVHIDEASQEQALTMLHSLKTTYERYHDIRISDEALEACVKLSARYIPQRTLPDKAIDLMDHSCAKVVAAKKFKVNLEDVQNSLHSMTGIPMESLTISEKEKLKNLETVLQQRVMSQPEAVEMVSHAIRRNRTGLSDPSKPWGSFLFLGPTGVGKTELAKTLAQYLFDDDSALLRFDMTEYTDKNSLSRLIGAPPGYVGYEQGGLLTDGVRHQPYRVILLDEIEKAHADVLNLFLQVLDEGIATDGQGNKVNFKNTVIVMTSNLGAHSQLEQDDQLKGKQLALEEARRAIKSELFNRIDDVLVFSRLLLSDMPKIRDKMLIDIAKRLKLKNFKLKLDENVMLFLLQEGFDNEFGARPMRRAIQRHVENKIATLLLDDTTVNCTEIRITMSGPKTTKASYL